VHWQANAQNEIKDYSNLSVLDPKRTNRTTIFGILEMLIPKHPRVLSKREWLFGRRERIRGLYLS